jgi:DNA polymerase III alpha subunit (gram-positive type)
MNYVLVDLETGGLSADTHAIMSVGMERLDSGLDTIEQKYWLVHDPSKLITEGAVAVNHLEIDPATATPVKDVLAELGWYFQDAILVAHNCPFDIGWLNNRGNYGVLAAIDTMMLSWKFWPGQKAKLGELAARLNLKIVDAHNSLGDVITMGACLRELVRQFGAEEVLAPRPVDFNFWVKKYKGSKPQWVPPAGVRLEVN